MRTYILALTKYGIVAVIIAYTILSFYLLLQKDPRKIRLLTLVENALILAFQLISYFTLYVALGEGRYMIFALLVMGAFFAIFLLYRTLYYHANMPLFNNMCLLLSVGLVVQSRLSFDNAVHQMMIASMGLLIAFLVPLARQKFYLLKSPGYLYGIVGIAVLAVVMLLGATTLGANITYTIAGVTFQPSEFVKILYILFLASTLKEVRSFREFLIVAVFAAAHVLVLVGSKDLGSALIFFVVFLFMAFLATGEWIVLAGGMGLGLVGAVGCYFMFSHIRERVQAFLDPWSLIDSIGYQITQSLFAIGAGGLWGVGLGQGTPSDVPFVESDFVFAAVCEELGQIVGVCIILVGISCFLVMLGLAAGFADRFYRLMAYGAAICYVFQMFLTLGGQTKFIPLTGVTLPFISYGGSSILSTLIIFTLVESMCILRGEKIEELQKKRARQKQRESADSGRYRERYESRSRQSGYAAAAGERRSRYASEDRTYASGSRYASEERGYASESRYASEDRAYASGGRYAIADHAYASGGRYSSGNRTYASEGRPSSERRTAGSADRYQAGTYRYAQRASSYGTGRSSSGAYRTSKNEEFYDD